MSPLIITRVDNNFFLDAIPTSDQIRVCPSIQDRKGWLWNTYKFDGSNWMFDVTYSITGRNTYGADGMVIGNIKIKKI